MSDNKQISHEGFKLLGMLIGVGVISLLKGSCFVLGGYLVLRLIGVDL